MATHHPDTRLLNEHAAGSLALAQSVCVTLHLNYCEQCRRVHQQLNDLGSAMFEKLAPSTVSAQLLDSVMARLDAEAEPLSYRTHEVAGGTPPLVQRLMHRDYQDLDWRRIGGHVRICHLRTGDPENEFALYHIKAGGKIPRHTHRGTELTLVLEGSFSDEAGHYEAGDFLIRDAQHQHTPTATRDRDCVCIGVLDAPVRFTDWRFRAANPFLRLNAH